MFSLDGGAQYFAFFIVGLGCMKSLQFYILLVGLVLSDQLASAQQLEKEPVRPYQWFVGLNMGLDHSFRTLRNNDGTATSAEIIQLRNQLETSLICSSVGLNVGRRLKKQFSIEAGFLYSVKGYQTHWLDMINGGIIDPRTGFSSDTTNAMPLAVQFESHFRYVDFPLRLNWSFGQKKIRAIIGSGVHTGMLIDHASTAVYKYANGLFEGKEASSTTGVRSTVFTAHWSLGLEWKASTRGKLRMEATGRHNLMDINQAPVAERLWSVGCNMGFYFDF
jgi:Outer membrane protein beta-barrel domain